MGASTDAGADGTSERVRDESGLLTDAGRAALGGVPEEWDVEVREISGQTCVEGTRERYRSAGTNFDEATNDTEAENWYSKTVTALDHPQRDGWQVVGKRGAWEALYATEAEAVAAFARLTQIYEQRGFYQREVGHSPTRHAYFQVEEIALAELAKHAVEADLRSVHYDC